MDGDILFPSNVRHELEHRRPAPCTAQPVRVLLKGRTPVIVMLTTRSRRGMTG